MLSKWNILSCKCSNNVQSDMCSCLKAGYDTKVPAKASEPPHSYFPVTLANTILVVKCVLTSWLLCSSLFGSSRCLGKMPPGNVAVL